MAFWLRGIAAAIWFCIACTIGFFVSVVLWRNPSNGHRFARILAPGVLPLLKLRVRLVNPERLLDHQPCVYVANHQSNIDLFIFCHFYPPRTVVTGKKEVFWIPFFGVMFYAMGNVILDRKRRDRAVETLNRAVERIRDDRVSVWIFPEGHRNAKRPMLPFKKGAFHLAQQAGVPIVPVVCGDHTRLFDPGKRLLRGGTVEVRFLEPIPTGDKSIDALIEETRARMEEGLKLADEGTR